MPVYRGLSVRLRGYLVPWSYLVIEDVHYLRSDLRRDPSFRDEADGGFGWQADGALAYAVTDRLSVELGFQYWLLESGEGDQFAYTTTVVGRSRGSRGYAQVASMVAVMSGHANRMTRLLTGRGSTSRGRFREGTGWRRRRT